MSHNKTKVGGQAPNVDGEIALNLNNLDDVTITSVADNQLLQYDNSTSQWKNETVSLNATKELVYSYRSGTGSYSGGTTNYSTNVKLLRFIWRIAGATVTENTVTGLILDRPIPNNWRNGFEFADAGTYLIMMSLQHYGSGNITWRFYDETNSAYFGPKFYMSNDGDKQPIATQVFTTTSSNQQVSLRWIDKTNPSAIGTASEMKAVSINVYKL